MGAGVLIVRPIEISGAQESPSGLVVIPSVDFDVTSQGWIQSATTGRDPIEYRALKALRIV